MKIQKTIKIDENLLKFLEKEAEDNCRSLAGQIEFVTKQYIKQLKKEEK